MVKEAKAQVERMLAVLFYALVPRAKSFERNLCAGILRRPNAEDERQR